jgi:hypothetical protein
MSDLPWLASLIKSRNTIDSKISALIGRTAQVGNVGEYIASVIFNITLDEAGKHRGYDGRFMHGPLAGQTVDIQWHPKRDGQLTIKLDALPDYYLVLTGPEASSSSIANPWIIESVFLFNARELLAALKERGVQLGSGTSITGPLWERAEIYPVPRNSKLLVSDEERKLLILFG